jgi:prevent-host-death family protein
MRIAPLADVKARLSAYLNEASTMDPVIITRNGKAVAVLYIPLDQDDLERFILAHDPRIQAMLERGRQEYRDGKGMSEKEFWAAVEERARQRGGKPKTEGPRLVIPVPELEKPARRKPRKKKKVANKE